MRRASADGEAWRLEIEMQSGDAIVAKGSDCREGAERPSDAGSVGGYRVGRAPRGGHNRPVSRPETLLPAEPLLAGRYAHLEELGRGASGRVLLVEDRIAGGTRAVKIVSAQDAERLRWVSLERWRWNLEHTENLPGAKMAVCLGSVLKISVERLH